MSDNALVSPLTQADLDPLFEFFPPLLQQWLRNHPQRQQLLEVILDLGQSPEVRFRSGVEIFSGQAVDESMLRRIYQQLGGNDHVTRFGIPDTLHQVNCIFEPRGGLMGMTFRVGQSLPESVTFIKDLLEKDNALLFFSRPGGGKTTVLRAIAAYLSDQQQQRVVVIDTYNAIGGTGNITQSAIGRAKRVRVSDPQQQAPLILNVANTYTPDALIVDELVTTADAAAVRTLTERGIRVLVGLQGHRLETLIQHERWSPLFTQQTRDTTLPFPSPTIDTAIYLHSHQRWKVYLNVADALERLRQDLLPLSENRTLDEAGQLVVTQTLPSPSGQNRYPSPRTRPSSRYPDNNIAPTLMPSGIGVNDPLPMGGRQSENFYEEDPSPYALNLERDGGGQYDGQKREAR